MSKSWLEFLLDHVPKLCCPLSMVILFTPFSLSVDFITMNHGKPSWDTAMLHSCSPLLGFSFRSCHLKISMCASIPFKTDWLLPGKWHNLGFLYSSSHDSIWDPNIFDILQADPKNCKFSIGIIVPWWTQWPQIYP